MMPLIPVKTWVDFSRILSWRFFPSNVFHIARGNIAPLSFLAATEKLKSTAPRVTGDFFMCGKINRSRADLVQISPNIG